MKYAILPLPLIEELILKIQAYEMAMEESFGNCRTIQQLVEDGEMPGIYRELIAAKENTWELESSEQNYKESTSKMKLTRPSSIRLAKPDKTIEE
jgi:hypothetical protein